MGLGVDKEGIALNKEKNMIKRKRLDARAFRDWHESLAKKHKSPINVSSTIRFRSAIVLIAIFVIFQHVYDKC